MKAVAPDDASRGEDGEIVCACAVLTRGELRQAAAGAGSFEAFLATQGANGVTVGRRCTACLLDLEYLYTSLQTGGPAAPLAPGAPAGREEARSLRHRLFDVIDRLSPPVPIKLWNSAPVLAGPGLRQTVIVANDSLLFERNTSAPAVRVELLVRDQEGRVRHRSRHEVPPGEWLNHDVSQYLAPAEPGAFAVGTLEVTRRFRGRGYRGTTRPQILLETAQSSSAVHTQSEDGPGERWVVVDHKPGEQRFFMSLLNHTDRPLDFVVSCPLEVDGAPFADPLHEQVALPPRGARLLEVGPPQEESAALAGRHLLVRCASAGRGGRKVSFIYASRDLTRLSIDHPS